jgi:hypothetical protein
MKKHVAFALTSELMERARNAVYWTPGLTLSGLVEKALAVYLGKLERKHGKPFTARRGPLKKGRIAV